MAGAVERTGWVARSVQTLEMASVRLLRKEARRSVDGSSERRM